MRRDQLQASLINVYEVVKIAQIGEMFEDLRNKSSQDRRASTSSVLSNYANYINAYNSLTNMEKHLISAFDLDILSSIDFWTKLIDKEGVDISIVYSVRTNIRAVENSVQKFLPLLDRDSDRTNEIVEGVSAKGGTKKISLSSITFLIREGGVPDLSLTNLVDILNNIKIIYDAIVRIYKIDNTELFIGSIDSGSDKSIDVIGVAEAVSKISSLLLEGWDRVRFRKEQKLDKSFRSISDGLSLLEKIKSSADNKSISPEEAERLKRNIIKSMDGLISNGVYTHEVENRVIQRPSEISVERRLMITYEEPDQKTRIDVNKNNEAKVKLVRPRRVSSRSKSKNSET